MQFSSSSEFIRKLNQIYHWILAAPLAFFAFMFLERRENGWIPAIVDPYYQKMTLYILFPLAVGLAIVGINSYQNLNLSPGSLKEKLVQYHQVFMKFHVYFSLSGSICLIGLYISAHQLFFFFYILILFFSSFRRPTVRNIGSKLKLNKEEFDTLRKDLPFS